MADSSKKQSSPEIAWSFPEFERHSRSRRWWVIFIVVDLAVFLYAIFNANFLFALILIMVTGILIFREYHEAEMVECAVTEEGVFINERLYIWKEMESFWFVYEPPEVKNLYLSFKSIFKPSLTIPLVDQSPLKLRDFIEDFIDEDLEKEGLPTSEALGRLLKL